MIRLFIQLLSSRTVPGVFSSLWSELGTSILQQNSWRVNHLHSENWSPHHWFLLQMSSLSLVCFGPRLRNELRSSAEREALIRYCLEIIFLIEIIVDLSDFERKEIRFSQLRLSNQIITITAYLRGFYVGHISKACTKWIIYVNQVFDAAGVHHLN